ncbi:MAG: HD domain-containing protein [Anaerolineae bacterium]|jgi:putative hydrolase of HD superfamily|nr:HD domain-containing protein [Anaerolineae bacterium]
MTLDLEQATGILHFLREAERLKNVYRSAWLSGGHPESTAAHTWRLCLMVVVLAPQLSGLDISRLLKMCLIHDLGEAIHGDIPAIYQDASAPKAAQERQDLLTLVQPLPPALQAEIIALWDEYEAAATPEAQAAKALDKLETLLQHNQGANPPDFDYVFNIDYGRRFTDALPLAAALRTLIDADTRRHARETNGYTGD